MFEKIIKRSYYRQRHLDAPLLDERIKYIQYWADKGRSLSSLKAIANYLLRVVEFLHLKTRRVVTLKEVKSAAKGWGSYQYNHPQKRAKFSKCGEERFTWYAIDWLKNLKWLEPLPEEKIPLFNGLFERRKALRRHIDAPFLEERLAYLQKWKDSGAALRTLRFIAHYLLRIIDYLKLNEKDAITLEEIQKIANKWGSRLEKSPRATQKFSKCSMMRFKSVAVNWLKMIGRLKCPVEKTNPAKDLIDQYVDYMRLERGLSEKTIDARISILMDFFKRIKNSSSLQKLNALEVDEIIKSKRDDGCCRRTIQTYASVIRVFLTHAEEREWCQRGLAKSIKLARIYKHEALPRGPSWDDVKILLKSVEGDNPTNIRDRAILMLLAVYGLRCGELVKLQLEDLDWEKEVLYVNRVKNAKPQNFPFSQTVGDAILLYLKKVRPRATSCRTVFTTRKAPHRPLSSSAIFQIVSKRLKLISPSLKHHGPHSLRHACATRLINEGISLKEIGDHLGHRSLESTRIYAKVDLVYLRKVADFKIGDLI